MSRLAKDAPAGLGHEKTCRSYGAWWPAKCTVTINMALLTELAPAAALHKSPPMANTYSQIYIQVVFAVQGRQNLIGPERKEELHIPLQTAGREVNFVHAEARQAPLGAPCL